jgi:hypothetical protein
MTKLHRRTLLRGMGVSLGLPLLNAMSDVRAASAIAKPVRMAVVFFPNGAIMSDWTPTGNEADWKLSPTLAPLSAFKDQLTVISGLTHKHGRSNGDGAGDHARSAATFLTAARPLKSSSRIYLGTSVDQVAASQLVGKTRLPSIELGISPSRNAGACDSGYSCAYQSNISWKSETEPMAKETIPRMAFERLFGNGEHPQVRAERLHWRKSILDLVADDTQRLQRQVGKGDQEKLNEYLQSVRDIEQRLLRTEHEDNAARPDLNQKLPEGRPEAFEEHSRLMMDLIALAFQTDTTRVATLMLDGEGSNRAYKAVGVKDGHHELSHHRNDESKIEKLKKIDHHLVSQYAYLVEKLAGIRDGEGTLLDQCCLLYGSGISDGNRHFHHDLPVVIAGKAGGQLSGNQFLQFPEETPMGNLYVSMLHWLGTPAATLGDSTGRLPL